MATYLVDAPVEKENDDRGNIEGGHGCEYLRRKSWISNLSKAGGGRALPVWASSGS